MRHAYPATSPDRTIWAAFYYGFVTDEQGNVTLITGHALRLDGMNLVDSAPTQQ
jgi:hypothetical protein